MMKATATCRARSNFISTSLYHDRSPSALMLVCFMNIHIYIILYIYIIYIYIYILYVYIYTDTAGGCGGNLFNCSGCVKTTLNSI